MIRSSDLVPDSSGNDECQPTAPIPAWWSGFFFHILNPRQVCMYLYLTMVDEDDGLCCPTIEQIREDLGLYSTSMVFGALSVLEDLHLIIRERRAFPGTRAKRNVYSRPPCEQTLLRLLERGLVDGELRPTSATGSPAARESRNLATKGLERVLDDEYQRYAAAPAEEKRAVLVEILTAIVAKL